MPKQAKHRSEVLTNLIEKVRLELCIGVLTFQKLEDISVSLRSITSLLLLIESGSRCGAYGLKHEIDLVVPPELRYRSAAVQPDETNVVIDSGYKKACHFRFQLHPDLP